MNTHTSPSLPALNAVKWILRIAVCGTFLGHGIFALGVKPDWVPYLTTVGFSPELAMNTMPIIGAIDIVIAFLALVRPIKAVFLYAFIWAFLTAVIRPVSGLPIWDFVERAANWGAPLAYLLLVGFPKKWSDLFRI